jgi:hypothetical protein
VAGCCLLALLVGEKDFGRVREWGGTGVAQSLKAQGALQCGLLKDGGLLLALLRGREAKGIRLGGWHFLKSFQCTTHN